MCLKYLLNIILRVAETHQRLGALAAFPYDLASIPCTYMVASENSPHSSVLQKPQAHMWYAYTYM